MYADEMGEKFMEKEMKERLRRRGSVEWKPGRKIDVTAVERFDT
jgi:hypothetical protein